MRLEEDALARRRDARRSGSASGDTCSKRGRTCGRSAEIVIGHELRRPRGEVVEVKSAELLVDDRARTGGARRTSKPSGLCDQLAHRGGLRVVGEERERPVAVGEEVHGVADHMGSRSFESSRGILVTCESDEVGDPDGRRLSAAVLLPGRLPLRIGDVREALAVGGVARRRCPTGAAAPSGSRRRSRHVKSCGRSRAVARIDWKRIALAVGRPADRDVGGLGGTSGAWARRRAAGTT